MLVGRWGLYYNTVAHPWFSPGVPHNPVFSSIVDSPASYWHNVIDFRVLHIFRVETTSVVIKIFCGGDSTTGGNKAWRWYSMVKSGTFRNFNVTSEIWLDHRSTFLPSYPPFHWQCQSHLLSIKCSCLHCCISQNLGRSHKHWKACILEVEDRLWLFKLFQVVQTVSNCFKFVISML